MRVVFLFMTKSKTNENFTWKLEAYEDYMLLKLKNSFHFNFDVVVQLFFRRSIYLFISVVLAMYHPAR